MGSGVDPSSVKLSVNGALETSHPGSRACRAGAADSIACWIEARYQRGRLTLEAVLEDRAGNRSNRLHVSWSEPRAAPRGVATVEVELDAEADTYLRVAEANESHGSKRRLRLRRSGLDRPALRFDLASIAGEIETLHAAHLQLTITDNRNDWGSGGLVDLHRVTSRWTEPGATWNCADDTDTENPLPDCAPEWWGGDHVAEATDSVLHTNGMSGRVVFDVTEDVEDSWPDSPTTVGC